MVEFQPFMRQVEGRSTLSRRDFIRLSVTSSVGMFAEGVAVDIQHRIYDALMADRTERPRLFTPQHKQLFFGLTPDTHWINNTDVYVEKFHRVPDVVNYFLKGYVGTDFTYDSIAHTQKRGGVSMVSCGDFDDAFGTKNQKFTDFDLLVTWMTSLPGMKILRPKFEFNMKSIQEQWYGFKDAKHFVTGWQMLYERVRKIDTEGTIKVCWSPNARTSLGINRIEPYFPGNDYFDAASLDVYNKYSINPLEWERNIGIPNLSPYESIAPEVAVIQKLTTKPWFISEANIQREYGKGAWMDELMHVVEQTGGVGFMPFLLNKPEEHNWNNESVIQAVRKRIQLPWYDYLQPDTDV